MPHKCIKCDQTYEDGTDKILSGCQNCGGKKFTYIPSTSETNQNDNSDEPLLVDTEQDSSTESKQDSTPSTEVVSEGSEDKTQHSARTDFVDFNAFSTDSSSKNNNETVREENEDVDLEALREELNRQFEGIKILEPGQYEINLTKLFERKESIIALQDDGHYVIQ